MMVVVNSKNVIELAVCVDCALFFGGADEITDAAGNDISAEMAERTHAVHGDAVARIVLATDSDDTWFSWSSCDGCESKLGGMRQTAIVLPA